MPVRRRYSVKEKPILPQSGEIPLSPAALFLQEKGWTPFLFEGEVRWIDPIKPYDISYTEDDAADLQLRRDEVREGLQYSLINKK